MLAQLSSSTLTHGMNARVMSFVEASLSKNTRDAYNYDIKSFLKWGGTLPATPGMVTRYLAESVQFLNTRTLDRHLKTLRYWHKLHRSDDPTSDCEVIQVMKGIKRVEGRPAKKAAPITKEDLAKIDKELTKRGARLIDYRDNALMQIGFYGAFRRSELTAIEVKHLKFTADSVEIFIPSSKTDQYGEGAVCIIPRFKNKPCPVKTLEDWLRVSEITEGPVFRSLSVQVDSIYENALDAKVVNLIIKKLVEKYNIGDPDDYSGHSLRRGFATSCTRNGASLEALMRHGRWRNPSTVIGYIEESARFSDNPASLLDF